MELYGKEKIGISVNCASGVESVLKKELSRLGYGDLPAVNGRIDFFGSFYDIARLNINLRTAERVYIKVKEFTAVTFDELFDGILDIDWKTFLPKNAQVIVDGKCVKSKIFAISASQSVIKKAIATRLCRDYNLKRLSEDGAEYRIDFSIFKDTVTVLINTSGTGLHKRGYRDFVGIAPIKETLASAMVLMSDFYYERPFADPFCGSGTIVIEALKIALDIAPNKDRAFAFDSWQNFDKKYKKLVLEEAKDKEKLDRKVEFFASDIDRKAISLTERHLERAGLKERVNLSVKNVKDFSCKEKDGTIVTNPPYGERVYDKKEAEECYKYLRESYDKLDNWSLFLITGAKFFEKAFGKKADRERKMYNSDLECKYYFYYKDWRNLK